MSEYCNALLYSQVVIVICRTAIRAPLFRIAAIFGMSTDRCGELADEVVSPHTGRLFDVGAGLISSKLLTIA